MVKTALEKVGFFVFLKTKSKLLTVKKYENNMNPQKSELKCYIIGNTTDGNTTDKIAKISHFLFVHLN